MPAGCSGPACRRWPEPDAGIWEIRGDAVHHVHSKLMGWLRYPPGRDGLPGAAESPVRPDDDQ